MRMSGDRSDGERPNQGSRVLRKHASRWQSSTLIICYNRLEQAFSLSLRFLPIYFQMTF